MESTKIAIALENFVARAQAMIDAHDAEHFSSNRRVLAVDKGRRYAKVTVERELRGESWLGSSRSVFCFVDLTNGDVLKAATWRAPAKQARGNIFDENPLAGVGPYGANYLR